MPLNDRHCSHLHEMITKISKCYSDIYFSLLIVETVCDKEVMGNSGSILTD